MVRQAFCFQTSEIAAHFAARSKREYTCTSRYTTAHLPVKMTGRARWALAIALTTLASCCLAIDPLDPLTSKEDAAEAFAPYKDLVRRSNLRGSRRTPLATQQHMQQ